MNDIFGTDNFLNAIVWKRSNGVSGVSSGVKTFARLQDNILFYRKSPSQYFEPQFVPYSDNTLKMYKFNDNDGRGVYRLQILRNYSEKSIQDMEKNNRIYTDSNGKKHLKQYLSDKCGVLMSDIWDDLFQVQASSIENLSYPTQKPEALLERIIKASSNEGHIVADFFCGSGTTLAVAEKLNRKWIGADLGKFAIHTTRKRMIGVQRQLKAENKPYRAFEILNLGKYERAHYIGINQDLRSEQKKKQIAQKEDEFVSLILKAYRAQRIEGFNNFYGKKSDRLVAIGPINLPVTRLYVEELLLECRTKHVSRVDVLAFEFEMGLFPTIQEEAKSKGVDLKMKYNLPKRRRELIVRIQSGL